MTVTQFPPPERPASIVGPPLAGNRVVVEGRIIPGLVCHERGDEIVLVLDGRFSCVVRLEDAHHVAWMIANALAIGAGYSHMGAAQPGRPFAPEMRVLDVE